MMSDEDMQEMLQKTRDLHSALLETPPGSPNDVRPLMEDIRVVVRSYHRASWATRALIWLLPAAAGVGIAAEKIRGWFV